jgi:hypothetical protein
VTRGMKRCFDHNKGESKANDSREPHGWWLAQEYNEKSLCSELDEEQRKGVLNVLKGQRYQDFRKNVCAGKWRRRTWGGRERERERRGRRRSIYSARKLGNMTRERDRESRSHWFNSYLLCPYWDFFPPPSTNPLR